MCLQSIGITQPVDVFASSTFTGEGISRIAQSQGDVLLHGECWHQSEMLVNHADMPGYRVLWTFENDLMSIDRDTPGILLIHSVENVHERSLAGTVLSKKGMDLTFTDF